LEAPGLEARMDPPRLRVQVPEEGYHRSLISCQVACPVHTDARGYVRAVANGAYDEAYLLARGPNPFASICGRVCGAPCEGACRKGKLPRVGPDGEYIADDRPIAIRALKRFACEWGGFEKSPPDGALRAIRDRAPGVGFGVEEMAALLRGAVERRLPLASGERIAVIGAGPAGLSAAHDLALLGFRPTVYEAERVPAGMLMLGVPEYRLPRDLIRWEVSVIEALGVEIRCGMRVGEEVRFADLRANHAAVLIAVGAKRPRSLGLPGEQGPHVYGGVDLLRSVSLGEAIPMGERVVVIGGGNVAYDVARTVLRQAAYDTARTAARLAGTRSVCLVSLETLEEMPADTIEIVEGDEEGIERLNGWGPLAIERNSAGLVTGVLFRRCLRVYDDDRKFSPVYDDRDLKRMSCDTVLLAAGQTPDLSFLRAGGADVKEARPGWPAVDPETLMTTAPGVFVAGDLAHGTRLLIDAVASGKAAARSVYRHVLGRPLRSEIIERHQILDRYRRETGYEGIRRVEIPIRPAGDRLGPGMIEVEAGYSEAEARREGSRCLDCGVTPVFDGTRCVLCGGCADVCPTACLKLVSLDRIDGGPPLAELIERSIGSRADLGENSAILKDEERCIRCALCEQRCPVNAITMERVAFRGEWRISA